MQLPKSILRKCTDMPKPIQRVKFTKAIVRHTKIRDQNPSLGYLCPGEPHERSSNAPKFEDRSQEETEWQEQGAREAAWKQASGVFCLPHGLSTLVIAGVFWCLLTFLGPSSVCQRDVQPEPQQVSQSSERRQEGRWSHVTDQHGCGVLTA